MQWMILQQAQPEDFVIAIGHQYSVRQFIEWSTAELGITPQLQGDGENKVALVSRTQGDKTLALKLGQIIVKIDPRYFRPTEVENLLGEPEKTNKNSSGNLRLRPRKCAGK